MLRAAAFVGPLVEAAAVVQQLRWHAAHPDAEPFGSLVLAHSGIYAGALVGAAGAAAWLRDPARRGAALIVLAAASVRIAALAADGLVHARGGEAAFAHGLYRVGLAVALVGCALGVGGELARWVAARSLATRRGRD